MRCEQLAAARWSPMRARLPRAWLLAVARRWFCASARCRAKAGSTATDSPRAGQARSEPSSKAISGAARASSAVPADSAFRLSGSAGISQPKPPAAASPSRPAAALAANGPTPLLSAATRAAWSQSSAHKMKPPSPATSSAMPASSPTHNP
eukprot:scaffold20493_cov125-Isochrysis_galbana.AAC.5